MKVYLIALGIWTAFCAVICWIYFCYDEWKKKNNKKYAEYTIGILFHVFMVWLIAQLLIANGIRG